MRVGARGRLPAGRGVVAVIDWGSSASQKENRRLFLRAGAAGKVLPHGWRDGSTHYRSLTLRADGACELQSCTTAAVARRLGISVVSKKARKVRMSQRG